jgi:hypothetical protein
MWVAVFGDRLIAVGDSAADVLKKALEAGITDPTVFRVPIHPERLSLF